MKPARLIYVLYLVCLCIFLLPAFGVGSYYSYQLGKVLILGLYIYLLLKKRVSFSVIDKNEVYLFTLYVVCQLFSVFGAINVAAFIDRAKDIIFLLFFFICSKIVLKNKQITQSYSFIVIIISIIGSLIVICLSFYQVYFINILKNILHPTLIVRMLSHLDNSKLFWESYEEVSIPLIFFYATSIPQIIAPLALIIIAVFASNFRTRVLMLIVGLIFSIFYVKTLINKKVLFLGLFLVMSIITLLFFYKSGVDTYHIQNNISVVDRFLLSEKDDLNSIIFRQKQAYNSLMFFSKNIYTGIGLGNYQDYSSSQIKHLLIGTTSTDRTSYLAAVDPHNVFFLTLAESGLLGFVSLILFLSFLIKKDVLLFKQIRMRPYIVAFWSLFIYSLFNPSDGLTYNVLFLSLRALL